MRGLNDTTEITPVRKLRSRKSLGKVVSMLILGRYVLELYVPFPHDHLRSSAKINMFDKRRVPFIRRHTNRDLLSFEV